MSDALAVQDVWVRAGDDVLVEVSDVTLAAGTVTAVVGASGSGKTLLLRALAGWVPPPLTASPGAPTRTGWMPQDARGALDPLRTVAEHLTVTARAHGAIASVSEVLADVGLSATDALRFPAELSGGMAQRVVLAQVLLTRAHTLLVDEPTSGLDPLLAASIAERLMACARRGHAVLWVTHDLRRVGGRADALWVMHRGRRVEQATSLSALTSDPARRLIARTPGLAVTS